MKKIMMTVCAAMAMVFSLSSFAAEMKIGVLDLHKLIQQSSEVKTINQGLEKTFKARQDSIVALQKQLQEDVSKGKRNAATMSANDRTQLEEKIRDTQVSLNRKEQEYSQDLAKEQNKAMQKFFNKLRGIVNEFAVKGKYDLILQKEAVPFASSTVEVTDQILKEMS